MTTKLTLAQIERLLVSLDYETRNHAYRRQSESRWWLPVLILIVGLVVMVLTSAALPGGW